MSMSYIAVLACLKHSLSCTCITQVASLTLPPAHCGAGRQTGSGLWPVVPTPCTLFFLLLLFLSDSPCVVWRLEPLIRSVLPKNPLTSLPQPPLSTLSPLPIALITAAYFYHYMSIGRKGSTCWMQRVYPCVVLKLSVFLLVFWYLKSRLTRPSYKFYCSAKFHKWF